MPLPESQRLAFRELAGDTDGIDRDVYARFDRDPREPIIGLGRANARVGFFGRDPGREEVRYGEPFIGAGGQLVRRTVYRHLHGETMPDFETSRRLGEFFFWINTVPYKPVGNKAWSMKVKRRFHPLMNALLVEQWQGRSLITLGREAFLWFGIGQSRDERARIEAFWKRDDRFERAIDVSLTAPDGTTRVFDIHPLPHPSPLNATWYKRFPALLQQRLTQLEVRADNLTT
ncbi:uracil-DNA glycosylase family protein [Salinisphaera sp.]|uniref:uracil-DNA glycosylase family protein n=1 Tax=Salinisphaera sp. TaxID=1914330 RepID=UPI000C3FA7D0|nr:uracil-DNA glycosylase family protein [Salinisphaera sp.]MAS10945.1 uracil-DNA glycosylase [Salinisphaera sp.]